MAVSQGATPKWLFTDKNGDPLAGGKMYTKRDINRSENKPVYADPGQTIPYANPVIFDNNGMMGPFYWLEDEPYYLDVRDRNGIPQFTVEHYVPEASGGSTVNVFNMTRNLINNGQFFYNIGESAEPIGVIRLLIAKGASDQLLDSDIYFSKSNTAVTDKLTFNTLSPGDSGYEATPLQELNYTCTAVNSGAEVFKGVEFYTKNVRSLEGSPVVISFSAHSPSLSTVEIICVQNFGTGGSPSTQVLTSLASQVLTNVKTRYDFLVTIPSIGGKVLGTNGNDFLMISLQYPLNAICDISFTNMQMIAGNKPSPYIYETPDMIAQRLFKPKTGDVRLSFNLTNTNTELGWVPMNDGSIGNASSGATTRANADCFMLFVLLYRNVIDAWAPVSGGRSGDPDADFAAGKTMTLPKALGRTIAGFGSGSGLTARVLGQSLGEESHVLSVGEMPSHNHSVPSGAQTANAPVGNGSDFPLFTNGQTTGLNGSNQPHNNMQPTTFMNVLIKL
jgi:hypothetical protein